MLRKANTREEASSPTTSTSGLRTYGSSPSSGELTLKLQDPRYLKDAVDYEHTDSDDARMAVTEDARLAVAEPDSAQASPPRLPGV